MAMRLVTVFGGSGFVGRHLVRQLARSGVRIRVAIRRPEKALFLRPMGDVGQIELVQANIRDDASVAAAVKGADAVVNLVGVLVESGKQKFTTVHAEGAARVARASASAGVERLVHVSALGADEESLSAYARTKALGEASVRAAFPTATIVRPGILFGVDDEFFNKFASMARLFPALPLFGGGGIRFQPAHVADVANAIIKVLNDPNTAGGIYELGGPNVYTFKELMEFVLETTGRKRILVPVPFELGKVMAWFLQLLPSPLLTVDQVKLLAADNVVSGQALSFGDLGIVPTSAGAVLPNYLWRYRPAGQFSLPESHTRSQG